MSVGLVDLRHRRAHDPREVEDLDAGGDRPRGEGVAAQGAAALRRVAESETSRLTTIDGSRLAAVGQPDVVNDWGVVGAVAGVVAEVAGSGMDLSFPDIRPHGHAGPFRHVCGLIGDYLSRSPSANPLRGTPERGIPGAAVSRAPLAPDVVGLVRRVARRCLVTALLVVAFMVLIGPLALLWGADSRLHSDRRHGWPLDRRNGRG